MKYALIGISGTNGAGKDTVGQILADKFGYLFTSVTTPMRAELARRGNPVDRDHMSGLSAEWRRKFGLAVLVDKAYEQFSEEAGRFTGLAVGSLRNPAEADRVHELGGVVLWVDADARVRYDRIQANAAARHRADEDNRTFEQFVAEEEAEMHRASGADAATLDMSAVKDRANYTIINEFDSTDDLAAELATLIQLKSE